MARGFDDFLRFHQQTMAGKQFDINPNNHFDQDGNLEFFIEMEEGDDGVWRMIK